MDEQVFQRYSEHYDLLYRDKDYEAEADYVARHFAFCLIERPYVA